MAISQLDGQMWIIVINDIFNVKMIPAIIQIVPYHIRLSPIFNAKILLLNNFIHYLKTNQQQQYKSFAKSGEKISLIIICCNREIYKPGTRG